MRDAFAVVGDGLRLVWRHLPVLLTLYLFGAAIRGGVIWLAVNVSDEHPFLAQLLLPLAPIGTLGAIIFMLRTLAPSLHFANFGASRDTSPGRATGQRLGLLASLLVPFLTVYSAQGFLEADRRQFINSAAVNEFRESADFFYEGGGVNRFLIGDKLTIAIVIVVALVLRRLINHFDLAEKHVSIGLFAGYVEIFWIFTLAAWATSGVERFNEWRDSRVFTAWVLDRWHALVDVLGPVGAPLKAAVDWVVGLLMNGTDLVVIPLAWLTVGAVAFGRTNLGAGDDASAVPWAARWRERAGAVAQRTTRIPGPVRRIGRNVTADLRDRFSTFASGVRTLLVAGLVPMLMFCIVFMVARGGERAVGEVLRRVRGPVVADSGLALEPWLGVIRTGAYTLLLVGLLGAAIDRIVRHREQDTAPEPEPESGAESGAESEAESEVTATTTAG